MPGPPPDHPRRLLEPFRFGEWTAYPASAELERAGEVQRLEPKVMEVLTALAARPGEVVRRQDLLAAVWPDTFVSEDVVWRCISELRKALGDSSHQPHLLETLPRLGYRLLAPVEPLPRPAEATPEPGVLARLPADSAESSSEAPAREPAPEARFRPQAAWWIPAVAGLALGIVAVAISLSRSPSASSAAAPSAEEASDEVALLPTASALRLPVPPRTAEDLYRRGIEKYYRRASAADREEALELFRQATEVDRAHGLAWAALADSYIVRYLYVEGDPRWLGEAETCVERAVELEPDLPEAHKSMGLLAGARGRLSTSASRFRRAIELRPDQAGLRYNLAFAHLLMGDLDLALEATETADRRTVSPGYLVTRGEVLRLLGRLEEARQVAQEALSRDPGGEWALRLMARIELGEGRLPVARALLRRGLTALPQSVSLLTEAAAVEHVAGELDAAINFLDQAAAQPPVGDVGELLARRAFLLQARGEQAAARVVAELGERAEGQIGGGNELYRWPLDRSVAAWLAGQPAEACRWLATAVAFGYRDLRQLADDPLYAPMARHAACEGAVDSLRLRLDLALERLGVRLPDSVPATKSGP